MGLLIDTINKILVQRTAPGGGQYTDFVPATEAGIGLAPNVASRAPSVTDNASLGYTTSSLWQYAGTIYQPVYSGADSAAWAPLLASGIGTAVDVMGTTLTKFAGGTVAMKAGYVGAAVDVAVTIGGVYQITTVNILANGELDNVTLGAQIAQADVGTVAKVLKIYDQSGNGNHAVPASAAGVPIVINGTITTSTTLTVNSVTTGTVVTGLLLWGNGVTPGTKLASGAGPYTLNQASAANPGPEVMYLGLTSVPYIDWEPIMGRYIIYNPDEQTANNGDNKRALQFPQAMTFTNGQNIGQFAIGLGGTGTGTTNTILASTGDFGISPNQSMATYINGSAAASALIYGQLGVKQNNSSIAIPTQTTGQPMCLTFSTAAAGNTLTAQVNESLGTATNATTNQTLAGGWLFHSGEAAGANPMGMLRIVGFAMFNAAPTAAQRSQLHRGAYCRFNICPQVINQVAIIGDSRLGNFDSQTFGTAQVLPKYLGRNFEILNVSVTSVQVSHNIGDGLVPTVTGLAKQLATLKRGGNNYAVVLLGVNDFGIGSFTVQQTLGFLQTFCAQLAAVGWIPILIAEMTTTGVTGSNPSILCPQLRAAIVAAGAATMNAAAIIDLYGYVPVVTPANTAYYYDGLHPTPATQQIIASAIAAAIPTPQIY